MGIPDNYDQWEAHDREQAKLLELLPFCEICGEPIQEDHFYEINDEFVCEHCLDKLFKRNTEDFIV